MILNQLLEKIWFKKFIFRVKGTSCCHMCYIQLVLWINDVMRISLFACRLVYRSRFIRFPHETFCRRLLLPACIFLITFFFTSTQREVVYEVVYEVLIITHRTNRLYYLYKRIKRSSFSPFPSSFDISSQ